MLNLTFGEQVKIVLSRKGMTIKELAEQIEERTGKKMSRQNLTQRLGRDNFQEQDMRMIAEILGCSFQLSILASVEAERASVIEEKLPTEKELGKLAAKKEMRMLREEKKREETVPAEAVTSQEMMEDESAEERVEVVATVDEIETEPIAEASVHAEPANEEPVAVEPVAAEPVRTQPVEKKEETKYSKDSKYFQPIKQRNDVEENREVGDINPYTGREYQSNSVRMHPKRIGYVQVYDRKEHKWTDMTEWAFLGFEEQKKATLGKDYEPPIYLD